MKNTTRIIRAFALIGLAALACLPRALAAEDGSAAPALPRLVDLGASKCVPCKMMKPILDKLTTDYAGRMEVVFIDVWEDREAGKRHGIRMIPTQIFYDAAGKELARHEGFMSEKDILAMWTKLGIEFPPPQTSPEER